MIEQHLLDYFKLVLENKQNLKENLQKTNSNIVKNINNNLLDMFINSYKYHQLISEMKIATTDLDRAKPTKLELTMYESLKNIKENTMRPVSKELSKYIDKKSRLKSEADVVIAVTRYKENPNEKDFDEIIRKYSKMMIDIIHKNDVKLSKYDTDISFDEVFHIMIENVYRAIQTFDPDRGTKFITHLYPWIYEVIQNPSKYIGKLRSTIKINNRKKLKKQNKSSRSSRRNDRQSGAMGHVTSADAEVGDGLTGFDSMVGDEGDFEQAYLDRKKMKALKNLIRKLPEKERRILNIKFGLVDNEKYKNKYGNVTDTLIAKDIGVSIPTIKNTLEKTLSLLRSKLR